MRTRRSRARTARSGVRTARSGPPLTMERFPPLASLPEGERVPFAQPRKSCAWRRADLAPGDAVALDNRPTPVLALLGVGLVPMLDEMLGRETGLCRGQGGHMHLFSKEHLAASSGIVGSAGPIAAGFALAAKRLRPRALAAAFFGDGAVNQGMLLESLNLAAVWKLPVLFVCKQNGWAVSTRTEATPAGDLLDRARAFSLRAERVDGGDVMAVFETAGKLVEHVRGAGEPAFLLASCPRLDGHILGDPLLRTARHPVAEGKELLGALFAAATASRGARLGERAVSLARMRRRRACRRGSHRGDGPRRPDRPRGEALMPRLKFGEAIDRALAQAMAEDERIVVFGEDVPMLRAPLTTRFRRGARPRRADQRIGVRGRGRGGVDGRAPAGRRGHDGRLRRGLPRRVVLSARLALRRPLLGPSERGTRSRCDAARRR